MRATVEREVVELMCPGDERLAARLRADYWELRYRELEFRHAPRQVLEAIQRVLDRLKGQVG